MIDFWCCLSATIRSPILIISKNYVRSVISRPLHGRQPCRARTVQNSGLNTCHLRFRFYHGCEAEVLAAKEQYQDDLMEMEKERMADALAERDR